MKKHLNPENDWVDIHNDELMISLGIHPNNYVAPSFAKTAKEKKLLRKLRASATNVISRNWNSYQEPSFPLNTKIIVYLKHNHNYKHQVYSRNIWMSQIFNYLNSFHTKKGTCLVDHYFYNGIRYEGLALPINPYKCNGKKK